MQEENDLNPNENESLKDEALDSFGESSDTPMDGNSEDDHVKDDENDLPLYVKGKLGKLQKRHQKDLRKMQDENRKLQDQMQAMHGMLSNMSDPSSNNLDNHGSQAPSSGNYNDAIQQAVNYALRQKDEEAKKAKQAEQMQYVHKKFQSLKDHLETQSDKYDDFDDVVRGDDTPFTTTMRDAAAMFLPFDNAGEVLYKLGKNKSELQRISDLNPIEQAKEMIKLSTALGTNSAKPATKNVAISNSLKVRPASSDAISEKTSVDEIRNRLKKGMFK